MPLCGVVFDFDGVIADTEVLHLRAYQDTLSDWNLSLSRSDYFAYYLGYDDVGVITAVAHAQGRVLEETELTQLLSNKSRHFETLLRGEDVIFPDCVGCIQRLSTQTKLAIASGALHHEISQILSANELQKYFEIIVAADHVDHPKPAPDGYLQAVAQLGQRDTTPAAGCYVAIEDSRWGLEAARAAGLKTIGITNTYPASSLSIADAIVENLDTVDEDFLSHLCS